MKLSHAIRYGIDNGTIQKPELLSISSDDSTIYVWEGSPQPTEEVLAKAWADSGGDTAIADENTKRLRKDRFVEEADPLFYQVQRGEVEKSVYDAKVAEIRADLPLSTD